jgi:hypothetical protein
VNGIGSELGSKALHVFAPLRRQLYIWQASAKDGAQRFTMSVSNQENSTHSDLI